MPSTSPSEYTSLEFFCAERAALPDISASTHSTSLDNEPSHTQFQHIYYSKSLCVFTAAKKSDISTRLPIQQCATELYACSTNTETPNASLRLLYSTPKPNISHYDAANNRFTASSTDSQSGKRKKDKEGSSSLVTFTFIAHMMYLPESDSIFLFQCEYRELPQDNSTVALKLVQVQQKTGKVTRQSTLMEGWSVPDIAELRITCRPTPSNDMMAFVVYPVAPNSLYLAKLESSTAVSISGDIPVSEHRLSTTEDVSGIVGMVFEQSASRMMEPQYLYLLNEDAQLFAFDMKKRNLEKVTQLSHTGDDGNKDGASQNPTLIPSTFDVSDMEDNELCYMENRNAPYVADMHRGVYAIVASNEDSGLYLLKVDSVGGSALKGLKEGRLVHQELLPALIQNQKKVMMRWFSKYVVLVTRDDASFQTVWLIDLVNELIACELPLDANESVHSVHQLDDDKCAVVVKSTDDGESTFHLRVLEEKAVKMQANLLREKSKYIIAKRILIDTATDKELYKDDIIAVLQQGGEIEATKPNGMEASVNYFLGVDMPGLQDTGIEVDPSDAIRHYMQSENLEALMLYLRKLHIYKPHRAESDHTELLLNLYFHFIFDEKEDESSQGVEGRTKREVATERLKSFLDTDFPPNLAPSIQIASLKALRNAGMRQEAMKQAYKKSRKRHEAIVVMEIEDWPEALPEDKSHFLRAIVALEQMMKNNLEKTRQLLEIYGERLLDEIPREATNLMIRVWCEGRQFLPEGADRTLFMDASDEGTDEDDSGLGKASSFPIFHKFNDNVPREKFEADSREDGDSEDESASDASDDRPVCPHHFLKNFKDPFWRMVYLECLIFHRHSQSSEAFDPIMYNTLIESYLEMARQSPDGLSTLLHSPEKKNTTHFPYVQPSGDKRSKLSMRMPRRGNAISDDDNALIPEQKQINAMLIDMESRGQHLAFDIFPPTPKLIFATFKEKLDMVLNMVKSVHDDKGASTLVTPVYDVEHVLLLVHMYNYEDGILMMYEKLNLSYEIIEHYKRKADYEVRCLNVVEQCEKHGKRDPNMWIQVLSYLTNEIETAREVEIEQSALKFLQRVLHDLRNSQLVPPLMVIQIISRSRKIRLKTIRDYLKYHLEDQHRIIDQSNNRIAGLENDVQVLNNEITSLTTQAQVFQRKKCASCEKPLQIPSVLFMCGHTYHQRCLGRYVQCALCQPRLMRSVKDFKSNIGRAMEVHRSHRSGKKPVGHHFDLLHEANYGG